MCRLMTRWRKSWENHSIISICELKTPLFNLSCVNAEVKLVHMSYNVAVRMFRALEILSDSPQAKVWWPSGEGAAKCRDIA